MVKVVNLMCVRVCVGVCVCVCVLPQFKKNRSAWVAQLVKHPTSAWVMISQSRGSSPTSGSVLTAQSLEPALDSVSPSLSAPPLLVLSLSQSQK